MSHRKCGECTLCCKLLPVRELHKKGGERCQHQRMGKGCVIYSNRPASCVLWSCVWWADPEGSGDMRRPDRTHYVVDIMPDFIEVEDLENDRLVRLDVIQVWVDPAYPNAHRDPALRAFLIKKEMAAIIRYNETDAIMLFPPAVSPTGEWWERGPQEQDRVVPERTAEERFATGLPPVTFGV